MSTASPHTTANAGDPFRSYASSARYPEAPGLRKLDSRSRVTSAALVAVAALLLTQTGGQAQSPLPYSRGFLVTGDYAVGGVDLREDTHPIVDGFSTAPIPMSGVPANADIIAAYLFWETVTSRRRCVEDAKRPA